MARRVKCVCSPHFARVAPGAQTTTSRSSSFKPPGERCGSAMVATLNPPVPVRRVAEAASSARTRGRGDAADRSEHILCRKWSCTQAHPRTLSTALLKHNLNTSSTQRRSLQRGPRRRRDHGTDLQRTFHSTRPPPSRRVYCTPFSSSIATAVPSACVSRVRSELRHGAATDVAVWRRARPPHCVSLLQPG